LGLAHLAFGSQVTRDREMRNGNGGEKEERKELQIGKKRQGREGKIMDKNSVKGPTVIHFFTHKSNNI
jgi:hypothetical protein